MSNHKRAYCLAALAAALDEMDAVIAAGKGEAAAKALARTFCASGYAEVLVTAAAIVLEAGGIGHECD